MIIISLIKAYFIGREINRAFDGMYDKKKHAMWGCLMRKRRVSRKDCLRIARLKERMDSVYDSADIMATVRGWDFGGECDEIVRWRVV